MSLSRSPTKFRNDAPGFGAARAL
jgi:RimJ/RimL family protein N-acetyltransferase